MDYTRTNTMKKPQKTLHISFDSTNEDIYFELMRQSSRTLVALSPLTRHYIREGMKSAKKPALI